MKRLPLVFLLMVLGCTSAKKEVASLDSLAHADTTAKIAPIEVATETAPITEEPAGMFPKVLEAPLTNDGAEQSVTAAFKELIAGYELGTYSTIKSEKNIYTQEREQHENEIKTWFFNEKKQLRAYTMMYTSAMGIGGSPPTVSRQSIYLFTADSYDDLDFVAAYNNVNDTEALATQITTEIIVKSQCPECGVSLSLDTDPTNGYLLSKLDEALVSKRATDFFTEYDKLINWLATAELKKNDESTSYSAEQELGQTNVPYTLIYTIDGSLHADLRKGNLLQ